MPPLRPDGGGQPGSRGGLGTFLRAFADLLDQWRLVLGIPAACMVFAAGWTLLLHPTYRATCTFIVDSENAARTGGGLASLAAQLGVPAGTGGGQSPAFFADLATSREVLLTVAAARYSVPGSANGATAALAELYRLPSLQTPAGVGAALRRLRSDISTSVDDQTSIVALRADAPDPALAAAVADTLLHALDRFNLERRRLRSRSLREFLASRLEVARGDLQRAEDSLGSFRERNRLYERSPDLQLQDQRLQRSVDLRQSLYVNLATSYEQARMEEFRDTPTLTVVDPPRPPFGKIKPQRRVIVAGAGVLGLIVALGIGLLRRSLAALSTEEAAAWEAVRSSARRLPVARARR